MGVVVGLYVMWVFCTGYRNSMDTGCLLWNWYFLFVVGYKPLPTEFNGPVEMPTENKKHLQFESYKKQLKAPWVMYADFEANTTKIEGPARNNNESFTQRTQIRSMWICIAGAVRSDGMTIGPIFYSANVSKHLK